MLPSSPAASKRILSIDFLRGIIMIIMALDHTRDFFHVDAFTGNPLDPATTYPILYFTRWVTHFCAPTFVFLSGLSAWLQGQRKTKKELQFFLITRGLWLILFDVTVMELAATFDIRFGIIILETLWSIGAGMVVLGLLVRLPFRFVLAIGLIIFFGHNLLDFAERARTIAVPAWWKLLHQPGIIPLWGNHSLFVFYPFLSWAGLALLGYCCGWFFTSYDFPQRRKILVGLGLSAVLFFVVLRMLNFYGDPIPWKQQSTPLQTFFAFMNVQKYPPSLLYLTATMGPVLVFLGCAKSNNSRLQKVVSIFGRVPLFYFVIHFIILHLAETIIYFLRGHSLAEGMKGIPGIPFKYVAPGEGVSLLAVYGIWILLVLVMYPLSKWYDNYKTNHREKWWLGYL